MSRRRGPHTTIRDRDARPAPDPVQRQFSSDAPDRLWVADITLAVVLDTFSRRIVGWAMAKHLRAELLLDALEMALGRRRRPRRH